jgi:fructose PTS system EIIBC or EIIC component
MSRIVVLVSAAKGDVAAILAAEALKAAAHARGRRIAVELRLGDDVPAIIESPEAEPDDQVLLVGVHDPADARFAGLVRSRVSVDQVLADPGAVIDSIDPLPVAKSAVVAVTSCPTGIAHTFMAAEGLTVAAAALGIPIRVETQGSVGASDALTAAEIGAAEIVLIAADREIDRARFAGKRVFVSGAKAAITDARALILRARAEAQVQEAQPNAVAQSGGGGGPYRHLMTGVSFMLPFVVAGGLLIALAFALGGIYADRANDTLGHVLFQIGARSAFALIVPVLAGYIAFSIADRPGIAPGMVGGMLAAGLGAGFLGGIVAGYIAGYGTAFFNRQIRLPKNLQGLKPVLILPVLGTLLTGLLVIYAVGTPVAHMLAFLTSWLRGMQGSSAILLGLLLGGMMAFDMGGPVNKAAYAFSTGLIASQVYTPMAAVMAAGMTPPLAVALATRLFANRFSAEEREAGNAAAVLGLAFISEGAIPFAARDPIRVIPALMTGSAVAGAISMALNVELKLPHGGIFVVPIPGAVTHLASYIVALIAGTVLSALLLGLLKRPLRPSVGAELANSSPQHS